MDEERELMAEAWENARAQGRASDLLERLRQIRGMKDFMAGRIILSEILSYADRDVHGLRQRVAHLSGYQVLDYRNRLLSVAQGNRYTAAANGDAALAQNVEPTEL